MTFCYNSYNTYKTAKVLKEEKMNLIAAVDLNWGIGYNCELLEKIPEDMKYFKEKTLGKVIVMGRNTLESLPNKKPLNKELI